MHPVGVVYPVAVQSIAGTIPTMDEVAERTAQVVGAGLEGVIVETNFCLDITTAALWLDKVMQLEPVLQAGHAHPGQPP